MKKRTYFIVACFASMVSLIAIQAHQFIETSIVTAPKSGLRDSLPVFKFTNVFTNEVITSKNHFKGKGLLLMHINSECDLCVHKVESMIKYLNEFGSMEILLVSEEDVKALQTFSSTLNLSKYPQIEVGQARDNYFQNTFKTSAIPFMVIFDDKGNIIKTIDDLVPIGIVIKYAKVANNEKV